MTLRLSFLALLLTVASASAQSEQVTLRRAIAEFEQGRIEQSVQTFDALVKTWPEVMPHLWQRGIALYYARRYGDCRTQFESHRSVNPADVENAAWHFLCVAREQGSDRARAALLPVGPDPRTPMREVYQMFRGTMTPDQVLKAAGSSREGRFYAHLYVGLYAEAIADTARATKHIKEAASDEFESAGGYMHMVARVHLSQLVAGGR